MRSNPNVQRRYVRRTACVDRPCVRNHRSLDNRPAVRSRGCPQGLQISLCYGEIPRSRRAVPVAQPKLHDQETWVSRDRRAVGMHVGCVLSDGLCGGQIRHRSIDDRAVAADIRFSAQLPRWVVGTSRRARAG